MRYGSVCSGVEAATVAWHPLGWKPQWFSEIEKFPSAVLDHHYPDVPNLGDMTKFKEWSNDPIDLLVGGTPCQSFSVAGLRQGLDDPRGNLMLTYLAIAERYQPRWLVWENVPGVLSSNRGRDFGTFLGALGKIGYGFAYRVLDAQYFGVAQRRRRVFVVGYLGDWRRAAAVLFERESLSGYPAPSREAGEEVAADAGERTSNGSHWDKLTNPHPSLSQSHNTGGIGGSNQELFSQRGAGITPVAFGAQNSSRQGDSVSAEVTPTLDKSKTPAVAYDMRGREGGAMMEGPHDTANVRAASGGSSRSYVCAPLNTPAVAIGWSEELNAIKDLQPTIQRGGAGGRHEGVMVPSSAVRRLTPTECERLQGFPDGYTQIPWGKKLAEECPDGHRYKAMGNSMAVPVMRWIGERINMVESLT